MLYCKNGYTKVPPGAIAAGSEHTMSAYVYLPPVFALPTHHNNIV